MAARAGRRPIRRRSTGGRRKLVWARTSGAGLAIVGASGVPFLSSMLGDFQTIMGIGNGPPGATVMRIRGEMTALPDAFGVASALQVAVKVGTNAEAAVAAEGPAVNTYDDWFLWEAFIFQPIAAGAVGDLQHQQTAFHRTIDVRAKRQLHELQDTPLLYAQTVGATAWHLSYRLSLLLALP